MAKFQKIPKGCLVFLLSAFILIVGIFIVETLRPRDKYRAFDFENDPWEEKFSLDYQQGISQNEEWVKDAETIALRLAGYPNLDNIPPGKVVVVTTRDGVVVVTVTSGRLMDDSVAFRETRVELVRESEIWKIVWAGWRQKCARDGIGLWTTSYCS